LAEQNAEWEDTLRIAGQAFLSFQAILAPFVVEFLKFLQDGINGLKAFLVIWTAIRAEIIATGIALASFFNDPLNFIRNFDEMRQELSSVFTNTLEEGFNRFFSGVIPEDAPRWFRDLFGRFAQDIDTATDSTRELGNAITELPGFEKLSEDLQKLQEKINETVEEFERKWGGTDITLDVAINFDTSSADFDALGREVQDYIIDIQRLIEDYARKRQQIIQDSNQAKANQSYRP